MAVTGVSLSSLLIELESVLLRFKRCGHQSVLKNYNGGLWEIIYRSGSKIISLPAYVFPL